MNIEIYENQWDIVPTNEKGEEYWGKSINGGNYAYGHMPVFVYGVEIGKLLTTSAEFPFCELSGRFGPTFNIDLYGYPIEVSKSYQGKMRNAQDIIYEIIYQRAISEPPGEEGRSQKLLECLNKGMPIKKALIESGFTPLDE